MLAYSVPSYCKDDISALEDLLKAMASYDAMHGESTTMRVFSGKCYQDTKYFERNVRDLFLHIAQNTMLDFLNCPHRSLWAHGNNWLIWVFTQGRSFTNWQATLSFIRKLAVSISAPPHPTVWPCPVPPSIISPPST